MVTIKVLLTWLLAICFDFSRHIQVLLQSFSLSIWHL